MQKLPLGIQEFSKLRMQNMIYVDKTQHLHTLIKSGSYHFLSRPRRFGKSLLVNTFKELFLANKHYFKGLWIEDKWEWKPRPVIHIDFSRIYDRLSPLSKSIEKHLTRIFEENHIEPKGESIKELFGNLINALSKNGNVAILIDEYDKPIIDVIEDAEKAKENRAILKNLYSEIKPNDGKIEFFFVTGVTKFTQVSIFSELNNLSDITVNQKYATICGYTQEELEHYFSEHLKELDNKQGHNFQNTKEEVKRWYNGYSWNGKDRVYNPFSILSLFENMQFRNFWFQTGTPTFLLKLIRQKKVSAFDIANTKVSTDIFNTFDIERLEINSILFQTGYLTIAKYDEKRRFYKLDYPNYEVEASLSAYILAEFAETMPEQNSTVLYRMADSFTDNRIDKFITLCSDLLKGVAYPLVEKKEAYFHSLFYLIMKMIGFDIECEVINIDGRIDAVVRTQTHIYIIEFKLDSAENALKQIKEKGYHHKYQDDSRSIGLLGIGFDADKRELSGYKYEELGSLRED